MIAVISPPRVSVSIIHGFTWIVQHADNYLTISNIERLSKWGYRVVMRFITILSKNLQQDLILMKSFRVLKKYFVVRKYKCPP